MFLLFSKLSLLLSLQIAPADLLSKLETSPIQPAHVHCVITTQPTTQVSYQGQEAREVITFIPPAKVTVDAWKAWRLRDVTTRDREEREMKAHFHSTDQKTFEILLQRYRDKWDREIAD